MAGPDLQGPLTDFLARTAELRRIVAAIESLGKDSSKLQTTRGGVDLSLVGSTSANTVNAMSLVFLASSFEEFVREELKQCASELSTKYQGLPAETRQAVRSVYWATSLTRLGFVRSILTKDKPQVIDPLALAKLRALIDGTKGFVLDDDPSLIDASTVVHHSNNFKAHVVDDLSRRIGMQSLVDSASESAKLKAYFGTSTKADTSKRVRAKLNEFYDRRNEIVHSLSSAAGYGVDAVFDYFVFFETLADSIRASLSKTVASW
ncbi:hypothetical protein LRS03_01115 [Rhizobacter sp. J219]|uniref:HEPN domain-containing protein n=1 Tax=Rhizobacter sp. J219 TaxID=2898430 RepID=UPI0021516A37|nr:HEPN domain-containing protein [Rhizobacter sp. J219]MCR5881541.1 hypothetical protein [Rhizobacter sp. J219]